MLYPQNRRSELDKSLFENPTSEYRGTPFWAWNCKLTPDLLIRQIRYLKEMGFGGFHMHSRTGMATPYLGDEFMELIKTCVETAKSEKMLAWLYDEDRWPSGAAGGLVTKNPAYRARYLLFTPYPYGGNQARQGSIQSASMGKRMENGTFLAKYEIHLDEAGCLAAYRMLEEQESGENVWYAYLEIAGESPWYNNQTYVNTLDKEAIDEFIRITYEAYKKAVGEDFGEVIPAIFTDEPQFTHKTALGYAAEKKDLFLPWTDDLDRTYRETFGESLLAALPEVIWNLPRNQVSVTRYRYHDHIAQRFADAFANNCGSWCRENNLMLTGHMMEEPTLSSQTAALGEAMRSYSGFDLPGIDILCDSREYTTAKQAQSAAHQFGREGVLSELYGVTNWDFDFRGHKLQGDWQAALGVTVRVPHLSWVSMKGEAKRDYPAAINYQSPWYREYPLIENHFARVNTAMTRGTPLVRVGVIHPIESYWLHWGPSEQTALIRQQMEENFQNITQWLLFGQIDFDFICESLLPQQCRQGGAPLSVGDMNYDTIIVPGCQTLRSSTVERLQPFLRQGGRLIVMGEAPKLVDALPAGNELEFMNSANIIPFERYRLLQELEPVREVDIRVSSGARADHLLTQMRVDDENRWLFIANGKIPKTQDLMHPQHLRIRVPGRWTVELYDTMTGEIHPLDASYEGGDTVIGRTVYTHDSLLLHLKPYASARGAAGEQGNMPLRKAEGFLKKVPVSLSEPNALLLDMAEYAFDDGEYQPLEEILRIDNRFRQKLGFPLRMDAFAQPWVLEPEQPGHVIRLRFEISSELDLEDCLLALEDAGSTGITFNGEAVENRVAGYYVDESIQTVKLPKIRQGVNILELQAPFGRRTNLEWCYILGDFGVRVSGFEKTLTKPVRELAFGDIVPQGLPFYGGNILYRLTVEGSGEDVEIQVPQYRGALVGVTLDGERIGSIVFDPYTVRIPALPKGTHEIGLLLYGNRVNTFGAVHNCDATWTWYGPNAWRTQDDKWSYEYCLKKVGILKSPAIIR